GADDPLATGEHAVNARAGVVPQRQPDLAPLAVGAGEGPPVEFVVLPGRAAEQVHLLGVEEAPHQDVTVLVVAGGLLVGQDAWRHGALGRDRGTAAWPCYSTPAAAGRGGRGSGRLAHVLPRCCTYGDGRYPGREASQDGAPCTPPRRENPMLSLP